MKSHEARTRTTYGPEHARQCYKWLDWRTPSHVRLRLGRQNEQLLEETTKTRKSGQDQRSGDEQRGVLQLTIPQKTPLRIILSIYIINLVSVDLSAIGEHFLVDSIKKTWPFFSTATARKHHLGNPE